MDEERTAKNAEDKTNEINGGADIDERISTQTCVETEDADDPFFSTEQARVPVNAPIRGGKGTRFWKKIVVPLVSILAAACVGAFGMWMSLDPQMRALIKVKRKIQSNYYQDVTDEEFYDVIFDAVNNDLLDAYSWYMTADEYAESKVSAQGNRSGFGLSFTSADAERLRISKVSGNSPAETAGIVSGEYILAGGKTSEALTTFAEYADFSAFVGSCETDETVYLRLKGADGERTVAIARAEYAENYVYYRTKEKAYRFCGEAALDFTEGGTPLTALADDVGYLRLTSFNGNAAKQVQIAMQQFRKDGKQRLVLDLRGNGGGYMHILQTIAQYFCKTATEAKPLVSVADYNGKTQSFLANGNVYNEYFSAESRICILADSNTASASECLLGAMLDYQTIAYSDICLSKRNGVAKTFGKGIMQTTFPLPFGQDAIKLTTARVLWPKSGNCIHGIGILPSDGALCVEENETDDIEIAAAIVQLGLDR